MTQEPDYVTVEKTVNPGKFCVLVMTHNPRDDEYSIRKTSQALDEAAARSLANSWAAALGVEIR
jgi:hypothetical protein